MNSKILVFGLHRVGHPPANATIRGLFVTPRLLSFQLWLVSKLGYKFSTLQNAVLRSEGKTAVITFDDGYEDNYTAALPVLEKFGVPATIFVVTGDVGKKGVVWDEAGEKLPADILSWEMLAKLQALGWEIGSHGYDHVHFDDKAIDVQEDLLQRSLRDIEENLGTVPISFAYPYGNFNDSTKKVLRRNGIIMAVSTIAPKPGDLRHWDDLLELRRIPVGGRRFYHYIKVAMRIFKALGTKEIIGTLIPSHITDGIQSIFTSDTAPISNFSAAKKDIVP